VYFYVSTVYYAPLLSRSTIKLAPELRFPALLDKAQLSPRRPPLSITLAYVLGRLKLGYERRPVFPPSTVSVTTACRERPPEDEQETAKDRARPTPSWQFRGVTSVGTLSLVGQCFLFFFGAVPHSRHVCPPRQWMLTYPVARRLSRPLISTDSPLPLRWVLLRRPRTWTRCLSRNDTSHSGSDSDVSS